MPPSTRDISEYRGDLIASLDHLVIRTLRQSEDWTLCAKCGLTLGSHSFVGRLCPTFADEKGLFRSTQFLALLCEYEESDSRPFRQDGWECRSPAVLIDSRDELAKCLDHWRKYEN